MHLAGPLLHSSKIVHRCPYPACGRPFAQHKTLTHLIRTLHQDSMFECCHAGCSTKFKRKDIRDRHTAEQRVEPKNTLKCTICNKDVQRRAIGDHLRSSLHQRAETLADEWLSENLRSQLRQRMPTRLLFESLVDPLFLAAWLLSNVCVYEDIHGLGKLSYVQQLHPDILELKGLATRSLTKCLPPSPASWTSQILQTVCVMAAIESATTTAINIRQNPHMHILHAIMKNYYATWREFANVSFEPFCNKLQQFPWPHRNLSIGAWLEQIEKSADRRFDVPSTSASQNELELMALSISAIAVELLIVESHRTGEFDENMAL